MLSFIKNVIRNNIAKKGFRIVRASDYIDFIKGTMKLYKDNVFNDFPKVSDSSVRLISHLIGTGIHEAAYIIYHLSKSLKVAGDVCEFGVAQGATSALLANEIRDTSKNLWLYDSFKGLPKPTKKDTLKDDIFNLGTMDKYEGQMSSPVSLVKKRLSNIDFPPLKVKIVPGFIKGKILDGRLPKKICFAYLDFDFYEPTLDVLNSINEKLSVGGCVIVDDYDYFSTGIKTAVQEFLKKNKKKYNFMLPFDGAGCFCVLRKIRD
jgi:hypothetical protein